MWCVDLPGTQSILIPNPGINQECTTSKLLLIILIVLLVGKTNNVVVFNNLLELLRL